ncbi:MAG: hypothetical protein PHO04_03135 [Candidatus Pacebacteria bacterium]|jgi:hypothetical protein|nr:hypothetical protein [Candidatus Paceibacterota bacterium]NMB47225.1 hypothetical protein [Patescibacteria group bacterium]MDD2796671.1 hypothetical protein [Candidatus Paceibacterota bacterium]MDD3048321.1 hypothetical protein [Candidatus Paceibacterota bacterium]MDD3510239.1 hypothetical protein [Candidatus Paceibacterota bacterium]
MGFVRVEIIASLKREIENGDNITKKLFYKQKRFMEINPNYPSLGKTKLENVKDKYGNGLFEVRLDGKRRIICLEKKENTHYIWLKICSHDEIKRKNVIFADGEYD